MFCFVSVFGLDLGITNSVARFCILLLLVWFLLCLELAFGLFRLILVFCWFWALVRLFGVLCLLICVCFVYVIINCLFGMIVLVMLLVCVVVFDSVCFVLITAYCVVFTLLCSIVCVGLIVIVCVFGFTAYGLAWMFGGFCWWLLCCVNSVAIMIIVWIIWVGLFIWMFVWRIDCWLFVDIVCVFVFDVVRDCLVLSLLCCCLCVVVSFVVRLGIWLVYVWWVCCYV